MRSESALQALYREARLSGFDFVEPDSGASGTSVTSAIYVYNDFDIISPPFLPARFRVPVR